MGWIIYAALQIAVIGIGIRNLERQGLWSWPMFVFALSFAACECLILILPLKLGMNQNKYFVPVWIGAWLLAFLNLVWFLAVCRRWKPRGR